jgi:tetratricopeptide (TPR) repeat protein
MKRVKRLLASGLGIEGLDTNENDGVVRCALFFAVAAIGLRFFFWWYTRRDWEDALISVLHSENFVRGLGLTHYLGGEAPLHGFTSPLSVLVPLMGDLFRVGFGLSFIKIVSAFAGGLTVLYAMAIAIHPRIRLPGPLAALVMGYLAVEHHQILWGMAGMETQIATLVLLASLYYTVARKPVRLGIALGVCMLARPDFAFWTVICGCCILARDRRQFLRVTCIALGVYLPWVVFTVLYYGSPIPNTLIAKHYGYHHMLWSQGAALTWRTVATYVYTCISGTYQYNTLFQPLGPCFGGHQAHFRQILNDHGLICDVMVLAAALGTLAAIVRRQACWFPAVAFVAVYTFYYIFLVPGVFSWYVPPLVAMAVFLSARGIQAISAIMPHAAIRRSLLTLLAALYVGCFLVFLPKTFGTEKRIQEQIENQVVKRIGEFLATTMKENETVGCEPLGYIGYYSQRIVLDWPGLASRRVVAYSKSHPGGRRLVDMLEFFQPDYIVQRYSEYAPYHQTHWLDSNYHIIASFAVDQERTRDLFRVADNANLGFFVLARNPPNDTKVDHHRDSLNIAPHDSRGFNALACRLLNQGKSREALPYFRKAMESDPGFGDAHFYFGQALEILCDYGSALDAYRRAVDLDSIQAKIDANRLGNLSAEHKRPEDAQRYYELAIRFEPEKPLAYNNLGLLLETQGRYAEALPYFDKALHLDPRYVNAHLNRGNALAEMGKTDEAVQEYNEAIRLDPGNPNVWTSLGIAMVAQGRNPDAVTVLNKAVEIAPNDARAHKRLAGVLSALDRRDEAAAAYARAAQLDPRDAQSCLELANLLVRQGKLDQAVDFYRRAIRIDPGYADAYFNLGVVLEAAGKTAEAIECYGKAIALNPSDTAAQERLKRASAGGAVPR